MWMRCVFGFRTMVVGIAGFLAGCGGSSVPTLAPVSGTIQMAGAPAGGVTVMFTPTGSTKTAGAFGVTGPDGKYELVHRSGERGIEPGTYTVSFSRMALPDGNRRSGVWRLTPTGYHVDWTGGPSANWQIDVEPGYIVYRDGDGVERGTVTRIVPGDAAALAA